MISPVLSEKIIVVGPKYSSPKGGIAQILKYYDDFVFEHMKVIVNSSSGKVNNIILFVKSLIHLFFCLLFSGEKKIVHIHTASKKSFIRSSFYVRLTKLMGHHSIMHIHSGGFKSYYESGHKNFVIRILKKCDAVVVLTEEWKNVFKEDLKLDNLVVIPNVIPKPMLDRHPFNDEKVHLLFMGNICKLKGVYDMIEVINSMEIKSKKKVLFHICGNGEVEQCLSVINNYGLNNEIKFEGWISSKEKETFLNQCDVLVLPSYIEALPVSILEGMSYGLPILSTNVGGIPSIVENGRNGLTCAPGDTRQLEQNLIYLLENKDIRIKMGEESLKMVEKYYPKNVAQELSALYESVLTR